MKTKKPVLPKWTTTVYPYEYDYVDQFTTMVKWANRDKQCFCEMDVGKVWGLVLSHQELEKKNAELKEALKEISTTAHCIALAGPLNTPTLQDAWSKFMKIDSMASGALAKKE